MASDRGAFIWYELMTTDRESAADFYREVVGWTFAQESTAPPGGPDYRMILRADGGRAGGVLTLTDAMCEAGAAPGWLGYVHHPDVDRAVARIVEAGGSVHVAPHDMEGVGRIALVQDPQGAAIYVMRPAPPPGPPPGQPDAKSDVFDDARAQHVRWNELQTREPQAAAALYGEVFGWEQKETMPMGEMGTYRFLHRGDAMIGAIMPHLPAAPRTGWTFYLGVDDIDRAARAVTDRGGRHLDEITEIPGGEFALQCMDPQGAIVGLVGPRKQ